MSRINQLLGLNSEASENAQVNAIEQLKNQAAKFEAETAKVTAKDSEIEKLTNEVKTLKEAAKAKEKIAVEAFVDAQIEAKKFKADKRDSLIEQATNNFDGFKTFCESLNGTFVDVTKKLTGAAAAAGSGGDADLAMAKKYHAADVAGKLEAFKNEVGEKKFEKIESFYEENIDKVLED